MFQPDFSQVERPVGEMGQIISRVATDAITPKP